MKKIELNKKTLRELSADEAMAVAGGTFTHPTEDGWCTASYECFTDDCSWNCYSDDCTWDCYSAICNSNACTNDCPAETDGCPTQTDCPTE